MSAQPTLCKNYLVGSADIFAHARVISCDESIALCELPMNARVHYHTCRYVEAAMGLAWLVENGGADQSNNARSLTRMNGVPKVEPSELLGVLNETALLWRLRYTRLEEVHRDAEERRQRV